LVPNPGIIGNPVQYRNCPRNCNEENQTTNATIACNREGGLKIASESGDLPSIDFKQIFVRKDFGDY